MQKNHDLGISTLIQLKNVFQLTKLVHQKINIQRTVYLYFQGRSHIFKIHARSMSVEKDIRYELLARLCPNSTGKYFKSV